MNLMSLLVLNWSVICSIYRGWSGLILKSEKRMKKILSVSSKSKFQIRCHHKLSWFLMMLSDLKDRIAERKKMREEQIKVRSISISEIKALFQERARKQQERDLIKKMEKEKKEAEEEERRLAEEAKVNFLKIQIF